MPQVFLPVCRAIVLAVLISALLLGQGTDLGTIRGTVTDASGANLANASVTAIDVATGATRETKANNAGEYEITGLKSGSYMLSVKAPGFATQEISGVALRTGEAARVDAQLEIAKSAE